jgi:peptidoglycan hydrolase-like protein with peptidoglycan-binding domain
MDWLKKNKWVAIIGGVVLVAAITSASSPSSTPVPATSTVQPATTADVQQPTSPAPQIFTTYLAYGSSGTAVANLQQFLADEGLYSGSDTGYFGQTTENAVTAFQIQEGITPANGVFAATEQTHANNIMASHPDWVTYLSNGNSYSNVNGSTVQSPAYSSNGVPAGATAICGDGTYSFSMHRSGTCSHHGGVSEWLQ